MATGDKIYIADKQTLDEVKTIVTDSRSIMQSNNQTLSVNTTTTNTRLGSTSDSAGTSSVFAFLKSIVNSITSIANSISTINNSSKPQSTAASKLRHSLVSVGSTSGAQTIQTIFSSTAPGRLYSVIMSGAVFTDSTLKITVDGNTILYMRSELNNGIAGGLLVGDRITTLYFLSAQKTLANRAANFGSSLQSMSLITSPLPIKVNSNLSIECVNPGGTNMEVAYTYIED